MTVNLNTLKTYAGKSAVAISAGLTTAAKRARSARAMWLFAVELAGVVLASYGISLWSIPAALIVGGLVLVGVIEVRPHVSQQLPALRPPETLLRQQAENAATLINNERFGLPYVDSGALQDLSPAECERVIMAARAIGASKT